MTQKIGLILEGGGAKGAYQAGALEALNELGINFDGVAGTSVGALNGSLFVQGGFELVDEVWNELTFTVIFNIDDEMISKFKKKDFDLDMMFYAGKKLASMREVIKTSYDQASDYLARKFDEKKIRQSKSDYGFVTFNMTDMLPYEAMKQDVPKGQLLDYVIASATYPVFPPKIIDDKKFIDGGVYDNMPINLLARQGYKKMLVIRTNTMEKKPKRKNEFDDLDLFFVAPKRDLGLAMQFTEQKMTNMRMLGYSDCKKALSNGLKEFLGV